MRSSSGCGGYGAPVAGGCRFVLSTRRASGRSCHRTQTWRTPCMTVSPTREPVPEPADLPDAIAAFVTFGDVANHTTATHRTYAYVLERFRRTCGLQAVAELTPDVIQRHLMDLRARMRPISVHQSFRTLRTFCRWCERTGRMAADPMAGMTMRVPKILPSVPNDEDVRRLLAACANTPEGRRNRTV